jgi:c-di-GMP-binding flagellar brake protein YcgR
MNNPSPQASTPDDTSDRPARGPLQAAQLPLGEPLPFALVDMRGTPLLPARTVLPDEATRAFLFRHFIVYRASEQAGDAPAAAASTPEPPLKLDNINLKIGARLRVRPPAQTGYGVVTSQVIGCAPNQALFVTPPFGAGGAVQLIFGERLDVLYVEQRSVYDFVCTVEALCKTPFEFLVLSPPANIRRLRARNATRMSLTHPVLYRTTAPEQPLRDGPPCEGMAMMLDVSAVGLSLLAPQALAAEGARMRVAFQLAAHNGTLDIDVPVTIRNVRAQRRSAGRDAALIHGLEFDGLDTQLRLALRCLVLEHALP